MIYPPNMLHLVDQLIICMKTNIMLEFLSACSPGQSLYPLRASSLIVTKIRLYRVCKKLSTSHHSAVSRVSCMTASVSHMTVKEYWPALSTGNPSKQTCHALSCTSPFNILRPVEFESYFGANLLGQDCPSSFL